MSSLPRVILGGSIILRIAVVVLQATAMAVSSHDIKEMTNSTGMKLVRIEPGSLTVVALP